MDLERCSNLKCWPRTTLQPQSRPSSFQTSPEFNNSNFVAPQLSTVKLPAANRTTLLPQSSLPPLQTQSSAEPVIENYKAAYNKIQDVLREIFPTPYPDDSSYEDYIEDYQRVNQSVSNFNRSEDHSTNFDSSVYVNQPNPYVS